MATNAPHAILGIEMYLLLISWGLISKGILISQSLQFLCLFLLWFCCLVLVFYLFLTESFAINPNGLNKPGKEEMSNVVSISLQLSVFLQSFPVLTEMANWLLKIKRRSFK